MSYLSIINNIKSLLEAVTGIGRVYDRLVLSHDDETNKSYYKELLAAKHHVWFITRVSMSAELHTTSHIDRGHNYDLIGYYAIDDSEETEKTFQQLADGVMNVFDDNDNIELLDGVYHLLPSQIISFEPVMFVDVLCHRVIIRLTYEEELKITDLSTGFVVKEAIADSAKTTSCYSDWLDVQVYKARVSFFCNVTATSGTNQSMIIELEDSPDKVNDYQLSDKMAIESIGNYKLSTTEHAKYVRFKYTLYGTSPSFTFSVNYVGRGGEFGQ